MSFDPPQGGLDPYALKHIRFKARQLAGQAGFGAGERKDLEQELFLDLLTRLPQYDPDRARRTTFISRVVANRVSTLIESQKAGLAGLPSPGGLVERASGGRGRPFGGAAGHPGWGGIPPAHRCGVAAVGGASGPGHRSGGVDGNLAAGVAHAVPSSGCGDGLGDFPGYRDCAGDDLRVDGEAAGDLRGGGPEGVPRVGVPKVGLGALGVC